MARLDWGFTDEEFADLDVRELPVLLKRHAESEKRRAYQEYREAFLCAAFATVNRLTKKNGRSFTLGDFVPEPSAESGQRAKPQTPEDHLAIAAILNIAFGGDPPVSD
jgi:hypothetical protein